MTVAYILARFPNLTETFILNEITTLRQRGIDIKILAIDSDPNFNQEPASHLPQVIYYGKHFSFNKFIAHLHFIYLLKFKYLRIFAQIFYRSDTSVKAYFTNFKAFSIAIYFLYRIEKDSVDLIHAHFINLPTGIASFMSLMSSIPYSCSAHAQDIYKGNLKDIKQKITNSKFTITCTAANKRYLSDLCGNLDHYKIFHVYHGVDVNQWSFRDSLTKIKKPVNILSIGRLVEKKGFTYLLEAISILTQKGIDVRCSIVGDGPLQNKLNKKAQELGIGEKVTFHGALSHTDVKEIYKYCDFFVLSCNVSVDGDRDGLPNVLLEAMAQGIPVISTNISAIPELVKHKYTGMLVPPHDPDGISDSVIELINNPKLRNYLSVNGRHCVENEFDINNSTSVLEKLFLTE
jgi:colanic acid/amylovoran biosynthesis glycosyltransferase